MLSFISPSTPQGPKSFSCRVPSACGNFIIGEPVLIFFHYTGKGSIIVIINRITWFKSFYPAIGYPKGAVCVRIKAFSGSIRPETLDIQPV
jgi:hypothetical protein